MEVLSFKKANCKDCYKCIRECPIKAIRVNDRQAQIIPEECILCGRCVKICPQNAKQVRDDVPRVKEMMKAGKKVVASLAPSYIAAFDTDGFAPIAEAIKKLGFLDVQETAAGANVVKREYERLVREKQPVIISSCCHSVIRLIQKYHIGCLPYVAKVLSPMDAHGHLMKEQYPDAEVVFISPCISKKDEVDQYCKGESISITITFDELADWFAEEGVQIDNSKGDGSRYRSRFFPETGGIIKSMDLDPTYKYIAIDGVENCRRALDEIAEGKMEGYFIEMSACEGSCVNGPCIREHTERRLKGALRVDTFAGDQRFDVAAPDTISYNYPFLGGKKVKFGSEAINDMLYKMGKTSPEKELNCGSCGYPTCRDKAIAILEGKAKIEMCLPFLKEKAESFSDSIINNTPNAIIVMDEDLVVQQINRAAVRMFKLKDANDILHEHIVRILNPGDYQNIITSALHTTTRMHYLADYQLYVDETILYDRQYHIVISLMRDVTEQETLRGQDAELRRQTVEITDKVIEKQMRVVQEIASLLGETTAETKIALTKLKDAMAHE